MGELLKILIMKWVSRRAAKNSQQSHVRQSSTFLLNFHVSLCPFYRPHNYQNFAHAVPKFTRSEWHKDRDEAQWKRIKTQALDRDHST